MVRATESACSSSSSSSASGRPATEGKGAEGGKRVRVGEAAGVSPWVSGAEAGKAVPTKEQMGHMARTCLEFLQAVRQKPIATLEPAEIAQYAPLLLLATLILVSCPRSQVLQSLNTGPPAPNGPPQTLLREEQGYVTRMSATLSKDSKSVVLAISDKLTEPYAFYLEHIRPRLVNARHPDLHYVFVGSQNGPRKSFVEWTSRLTQAMCGQTFTPKDFRTATVSLYYEGKSNLSELDLIHLSTAMNHSTDTARKYYFQLNRDQNSRRINEEMNGILLGGGLAQPPRPPAREEPCSSSSSSSIASSDLPSRAGFLVVPEMDLALPEEEPHAFSGFSELPWTRRTPSTD